MTERAVDAPTDDVSDLLSSAGVVPVVTVHRAQDGVEVTRALVRGGLFVVEFALRTTEALEALRRASRVPGAVVGAATVMSVAQAREALSAGARFVVTPGFDQGIVDVCRSAAVPVLPGVATPTELMRAAGAGLRLVKLFPIEPLGGLKMVRALAALDPRLGFVPSGGITEEKAPAYLATPQVIAVAGSWMVPEEALATASWPTVERLAAACASWRSNAWPRGAA